MISLSLRATTAPKIWPARHLDRKEPESMMALQSVAVIGAGTMGRGIAQVSALSGFATRLFDVDAGILADAIQQIDQELAVGIARKKMNEDERALAMSRLTTVNDLDAAVQQVDLVIEAVPERMTLKQEIFGQVSAQVPQHTILASNTSSLSISEIAAGTPCPERVIGMHFFNPAHIVRLLEIVRGRQTSEQVVDTVREIGRLMNRELVVVNDSPGFASSRLGIALGMEAIRMVEQGVASPEDIDAAMVHGYRHPIGPLRLGDLVGLDVRLSVGDYLCRALGAEHFRPPDLLQRMVAEGKLGRKSGEGFYVWED